MPMAGKGMLLTSMNMDTAHEAEFNRWYDREHLEERVAIDGFLEARRYVAHDGNPKYLSLYSTETFEVLDSPAYRTALSNQTAWSKANIARFQNMIRAVARITISQGTGRGAALGIVRLRPPSGGEDKLRAALREQLDPAQLDGIISMHLIESDPALSKPITDDPSAPDGTARQEIPDPALRRPFDIAPHDPGKPRHGQNDRHDPKHCVGGRLTDKQHVAELHMQEIERIGQAAGRQHER